MKRRGFAAVLLGCLVVTAVPGLAAAADASTAWRVEPTPAHSAGLSSVSCVSPSHCVAVGGDYAISWNGSAWSSLPVPTDSGHLNAVACTSTAYCIAVGQATSGLAQAWSWNGHAWSDQSTYNPGSNDNFFSAITCAGASSCEAVGTHGKQGGTTYPLAEVWNGSNWTDQSTYGAPAGALASVGCESPSKCQAVGQTSGNRTLAMGLHGTTWASEATPRLHLLYGSPSGSNRYAFTGVSCYSGGCTAVGWQYYCDCSPEASGDVTLAETWNGSRWALMSPEASGEPSTPAPATYALWQAVRCQSVSNCVAVGSWTDDNEAQPVLTLADTWNGTSWKVEKTPSPGSSSGTNFPGDALNAVTCVSGSCTAVGNENGVGSDNSLAMRS